MSGSMLNWKYFERIVAKYFLIQHVRMLRLLEVSLREATLCSNHRVGCAEEEMRCSGNLGIHIFVRGPSGWQPNATVRLMMSG